MLTTARLHSAEDRTHYWVMLLDSHSTPQLSPPYVIHVLLSDWEEAERAPLVPSSLWRNTTEPASAVIHFDFHKYAEDCKV